MKMKVNEHTKLCGKRIVMVPYEKCHVPRYHEWMKSEELLQLTASEPLTLEEEYQMQQSWRQDENKCTFIVLDRRKYDESSENEADAMVGDVNLFFNDSEDKHSAEIEIMIAEPSARGQGLGKEAVFLMMRYGIENLQVKTFTVKIGFDNVRSIGMFSHMGFKETSRSEVFQEITLALPVCDSTLQLIQKGTNCYDLQQIK